MTLPGRSVFSWPRKTSGKGPERCKVRMSMVLVLLFGDLGGGYYGYRGG
jgi:hypothetical protein